MKRSILFVVFILSFFLVTVGYSQDSEADKLCKEAVSKMDNEQDFPGAIALLNQAIKLEPKNLSFQYEKAFAYHKMGDYNNSVKILEKLVKSSAAEPLYFQLLGNSYNRLGEADKSDEIYQKGIKKFPDAGILYSGKGLVEFNMERYEEALGWFEKGIEMDPNYRSNYYFSSILFAGSTETVWSVLYGEIFCNLEPEGKRYDYMSKALFDTYDTCITFKDSSIAVSFTKNITISIDDIQNFKLPFANTAFEMNLMLSLVGETEISIATLSATRTKFIGMYYSNKQNIEYPNILFEYHKKLIDAGFFDCYNYWLFYEGNKAEADAWLSQHKEKYAQFAKWFAQNPLELSSNSKFYRMQYSQ